MFCRGEDGYSIHIPQVDPLTHKPVEKKDCISYFFYAYRIMKRQSNNNHLRYYRSIFNQYLVDMYAKIETGRLMYIKMNQKKLRSEEYIHLRDTLRQNKD